HVLNADLRGGFIGDPDGPSSGKVPPALIAGAVGVLVQLVGDNRVERTVLVDAVHAEGVAERAIIAEIPPYSAAARAIGLAAGIQAVVASPVLAGRNQRVEGEAAPLGRFIPDRMGEPRIELRAVVPAGVAHDAVVVAYRRGERVHPRGRELVGRVGL